MKTNWKSLALLGGLAMGCFAAGTSPRHPRLSFGYSGPGVSVGVNTGGGFYGGGFYGGGYPVVTPGPVVVASLIPRWLCHDLSMWGGRSTGHGRSTDRGSTGVTAPTLITIDAERCPTTGRVVYRTP